MRTDASHTLDLELRCSLVKIFADLVRKRHRPKHESVVAIDLGILLDLEGELHGCFAARAFAYNL